MLYCSCVAMTVNMLGINSVLAIVKEVAFMGGGATESQSRYMLRLSLYFSPKGCEMGTICNTIDTITLKRLCKH